MKNLYQTNNTEMFHCLDGNSLFLHLQQKNSPLHLAVIKNNLSVVNNLLDANHNINSFNEVSMALGPYNEESCVFVSLQA